MLRIGKLADYATMVMVYLVRHPGIVFNAVTIAKEIHLAVPTVTKLLKLLTKAELLISQRGKKGGYILARAAESISIAEIIGAVEGSLGLTECSVNNSHCSLQSVCHIQENWQLISKTIENALSGVNLAEFALPMQTLT